MFKATKTNMTKKGKILAVDDNEDILSSLRLLLRSYAEKIVTTNNASDIPELMKNELFIGCYFAGYEFHR